MASYERPQKPTLVARLNEKPARLILITDQDRVRRERPPSYDRSLDRLDRPRRYLAVDAPDAVTLPPFPFAGDEQEALAVERAGSRTGERDVRWLVRRWEEARIEAERSERGFVLVFDEIQKIDGWSEAVKGLWDADRHHGRRLHVVLLGSAPLIMQRGMTESLAGRYETIRLTHWSFVEMSEAFGVDLPGYVYFGGYPGAAAMAHDQERWREYITGSVIEPNIERDVLSRCSGWTSPPC